MSQTTDNALRLSIEVAVDVERAFDVFTKDFDRIKPREHNMLGEPIEETILELRAGGRLYDRGASGATCDWGGVLAFEPPHRLLLAWNISPHWQLETDPSHASEIKVTFTAIDDRHTRVDLEVAQRAPVESFRHRRSDGLPGRRGRDHVGAKVTA